MNAILFDLDNCLAPADELGQAFLLPVFQAIRQANHGTLSDETLEIASAECWFQPFDFVAQKYRFTEVMTKAGWNAYSALEVADPMVGYPDLPFLSNIDARRFLVTSGFRRLQQSKIEALGIGSLFEAVIIDAIDEPERSGKEKIFHDILVTYALDPECVFVVGDNPDSEIKAGKNLGLVTVQILRPNVVRGKNADHYISSLKEIPALMHSE
jgi:putative hydrolase of the HAD superfamily